MASSKPPNNSSRKIAAAAAVVALVNLYAYQKAWITDESRFKLAVKGRQEGFTFATTLRVVRRRLKIKGTTVWVSASERQSREAIEYAKQHLAALGEAFDADEIAFEGVETKALQITFRHNGSRFIAMPANPDTMRGFSGDVVLDEFGFHRDAKKIWRAALAIASRGYQVEVISTPNGQAGEYWELCKAANVPALGGSEKTRWKSGVWSVHWIDIYTAAKQGCPINVDEMRAAAGDEDTWLQEYCCVFLADAENFIPMELVIANEHSDATADLPQEFTPIGDCFGGYDVGRKKDRSVLWLVEQLGDVKWTRLVKTMQRETFEAQRAQIDLVMPLCRRFSIDSTGIGAQMGEELVKEYGSKVEAVEFNIANKESMATSVKRELEERRLRIPASPAIRRAINAVKRYASTTGHFRFDAERTDAGHADEFWALALAVAAGTGNPNVAMKNVGEVAGMFAREARGLMSRAAQDVGATERGKEIAAIGGGRRGLLGLRDYRPEKRVAGY